MAAAVTESSKNFDKKYQEFKESLFTIAIPTWIAKTVSAPFQRLRLIHQAQNTLLINERSKFSNAIQYFTRIPQEQGISAFWRGNFTNCLTMLPKVATHWFLYQNFKRLLFSEGEHSISTQEHFIRKLCAATLFGTVSMIFTYPVDVIKTRLSLEFVQSKKFRTYPSYLGAMSEMFSTDGFRSFYRGYLLSVFITIPQFIAFYSTLDFLVENQNSDKNRDHIVFQYFTTVGLASLLSEVIIHPLDTVRRRMQMNGHAQNYLYNTSFDCIQQIYKQQGVTAFFKGSSSNLVQNIIANLTFSSTLILIKENKGSLF